MIHLPDLAVLHFLAKDDRRFYETEYLIETLKKDGFTLTENQMKQFQKKGLTLKTTRSNQARTASYWSISREGQAKVLQWLIALDWYRKTP